MSTFDATALLRHQGHRVTPQRIVVLATLQAQDQPLTVEELHAAVREQQPTIDLTTIYRVLQFLQNVRLAASLNLDQGPQRYKYRQPGDLHHHLICKRCGTNIQVPDSLFAAIRHEIDERYAFTMEVDHMLLHGLCAACRTEMSTL